MVQPKRRKTDATVTGDHCKRFGAIAVRQGIVFADDVKAAVNEQIDDNVNGREHRLIGTILYDNGCITEHQIEAVLMELRKAIA